MDSLGSLVVFNPDVNFWFREDRDPSLLVDRLFRFGSLNP